MAARDEARRSARWSMRRRLIVWLVGSVVGVVVVALPDSDDRLFSFSRTHGPSPVDVLGMLVLIAVWLPVAHVLWLRRRAFHGRSAGLVAVLAVAGTLGLATTVGFDLGPVYLAAVALLVGAHMLALRVVAHPDG